jgi:hypothetical protein
MESDGVCVARCHNFGTDLTPLRSE